MKFTLTHPKILLFLLISLSNNNQHPLESTPESEMENKNAKIL